jgi:uncharacterized protein (DUF486 family)
LVEFDNQNFQSLFLKNPFMIEIGNVMINNEQLQYLKEWIALVIMNIFTYFQFSFSSDGN